MTIFFKTSLKKIILIILTISILFTFFAEPSVYASSNFQIAKLDIQDGEFYYSGTTKGTYTVTEGIFAWLLNAIGEIADWLIGLLTMGFRMVFVGWTALFERLLTWALQTTTGVNMEGEDLVENSTDLMNLITSSNNVTVEAIVYNQVPALDVNFFKTKEDMDPTISGTGQKLTCEVCGKHVDECMSVSGSGAAQSSCASECGCTAGEECCDACEEYIQNLKIIANPNSISIVQMLRDHLAEWYYIIRVLAFAVMLLILIAIGIKMAISNIASEKAVYKRMLVDWLVGLIILVGIHYIMYFTFIVNETLVDSIHEFSKGMNKAQMQNLNLMTLAEKSGQSVENYENQDLEIKVYEEIRTRAYDPKLTVGLPGMIMYMTLVYFAVRYTIVYVKRYITIMILALMGPGLGVSYAFQKVFTGKSPSYSKWLKEFVMNVIIQVIHAILYSIFIAQALILALDSLAGMIIALVFMNFALKADKTFRKIFNMSGELIDSTESAGDPDTMKQPFNAVKGFFKASATKTVGKALLNTPYAKGVKALGKIGVAGAASAVTGIAVGGKKAASMIVEALPEGAKEKLDEIGDRMDNAIEEADNNNTNGLPIRVLRKLRGKPASKQQLDENLEKAREEYNNARTDDEKIEAGKKYAKAKKQRDKAQAILKQPGALKIAATRFTRAIDVRNTFNFRQGFHPASNFMELLKGTFGTKTFNPSTGKRERDYNGIYSKLAIGRGIMGLDDKDKKALKDFSKFAASGLVGMASMFVGMGTLVAHPKAGLTLLAHGAYQTERVFGLKTPDMKNYRQRSYTFSEFSEGAINNMRNTAKYRSAEEMQQLMSGQITEAEEKLQRRLTNVENKVQRKILMQKYNARGLRGIFARIKGRNQGIAGKQRTLRAPSQIRTKQIPSIEYDDGITVVAKPKKDRRPITNFGAEYAKMMEKFEKEARQDYVAEDYLGRQKYKKKYGRLLLDENGNPIPEDPKVLKDYLAMVKAFDSEAENIEDAQAIIRLQRLKKKAERQAQRRMQSEALQNEFRKLGFSYDIGSGVLSPLQGQQGKRKASDTAPAIARHDLYGVAEKSKARAQANMHVINQAFDHAILQISNGGRINLSDERTYNKLVTQVTTNLREAGVLGQKQEVGSLFKKGRLRSNIEQKVAYTNTKIHTLDKFLERSLSKEEAASTKKAVTTALAGADLSTITAKQIFDQINGFEAGKKSYSDEEKRKIAVIDKYLKALRQEGGEYTLIQAAVERDNPFVEQRERQARGALQRILEGEFTRAGIGGNPEISLRRVSSADIDRRSIKDGVISETRIKKINKELQKAITEVAKVQELNATDKDQLQQITDKLTQSLRDAGIIASFQTADTLFKKGKFQEIVVNQMQVASSSSIGRAYMSRESIRSSDVELRKITIEDLAPATVGKRLTAEDVATINVEIQSAVIEESVAIGFDNRKKLQKQIMKTIAKKLVEDGILTSSKSAKSLFKEGMLEEVVEDQIVVASTRQTEIKKYNEEMEQGNDTPAQFVSGIDSSSIDTSRAKRTYTTEDLLRINVEIRSAVVETADGERLDVDDRKTRRALEEAVTERLYDAGLIDEGQRAEEIFKKGVLEQTLREETLRANAKSSGLDTFLDTILSDDEVHAVREVVSSSTEAELTEMTRDELYDRIRALVPETQEEREKRDSMFMEEIEAQGFSYDEDSHEVDVSRELTAEEQDSQDRFNRILVDVYAAQGLIYDPKTGTTKKAESERATEVEETRAELEEVVSSREEEHRLTSADYALVYSEIDAIIMQLANGNTLDFSSDKTISEILKLLSNKLGSAGLLSSDQTITSLFSRGSLEKVIKDRSVKANIKIEASQRRMEETLSLQESEQVRSVIDDLAKKAEDVRAVSAEEVYSEMVSRGAINTDESRPSEPVVSEGRPEVDSEPRTLTSKISAIDEHLRTIQQVAEQAETVRTAREMAETRRQEMVESDRAEKEAVLGLYLESRREEAVTSEATRTVARNISSMESEGTSMASATERKKMRDNMVASGLLDYMETLLEDTTQTEDERKSGRHSNLLEQQLAQPELQEIEVEVNGKKKKMSRLDAVVVSEEIKTGKRLIDRNYRTMQRPLSMDPNTEALDKALRKKMIESGKLMTGPEIDVGETLDLELARIADLGGAGAAKSNEIIAEKQRKKLKKSEGQG